jgi:hypothetical protein
MDFDISGMAAAATALVATAATGAATAAGGSAANLVATLVKRRLDLTAEGRTALSGAQQAPDDPTAAESLRAVLREVLTNDPDFARQLAVALNAPPAPPVQHHHPGGISLGDGNRVRGHITVGPLTITNNRTTRMSFAAIAVLLLALLIFGLSSGSVPFVSDDRPPHRARVITTIEESRRILPGAPSSRWRLERPIDVVAGDANTLGCYGNDGVQTCGLALYREPVHRRLASFYVSSYDSVEDAQAALDDYRSPKWLDEKDLLDMPDVGDESISFKEKKAGPPQGPETNARVGTVIISTHGSGTFDLRLLADMSRVLAERAQQAQDGQPPVARIKTPRFL